MPNLQPIRPPLVGIGGRLRDDHLDLFDDDDATGRSTAADLRAGRRSCAVSALLAAADETQRAVVESALGDPYCPRRHDRAHPRAGPAARRGREALLRPAAAPVRWMHDWTGGRLAGGRHCRLSLRATVTAGDRTPRWVPVEKDYRFGTADGTTSLADLFGGRSRLLVHHFVFGPPYEAGCPATTSTPAASMLAAI